MAHTNSIPGYRSVHIWIQRRLGTPNRCSRCGVEHNNSRRFHWANISGDYKKDITDWERLCVRCHKALDGHAGLLFKEHCSRGHKLTIDRLYFQKQTNTIICRDCSKENTRAWRLRRRNR